MKTKLCLAFILLVPAFAFGECLVEAESDRQRELLETAERAWVEYRDATCELIAERDREDLRVEALVTCLNFLTRQRDFELQLMDRVLTFTNVRSILDAQ